MKPGGFTPFGGGLTTDTTRVSEGHGRSVEVWDTRYRMAATRCADSFFGDGQLQLGNQLPRRPVAGDWWSREHTAERERASCSCSCPVLRWKGLGFVGCASNNRLPLATLRAGFLRPVW